MIELMVIDVDYTLLDNQGELSERNELAIRKAAEQGVQIVLATGKTRKALENIIAQLGLQTPGIYNQGLAVYDGEGTLLHQQTLDPAIARTAITFAEDRGFDVAAYSESRILAKNSDSAAYELSRRYHEPEPEPVGPLVNVLGTTQINKLIMMRPNAGRKINALRWLLEKQIDGRGRLLQGAPDSLELLPAGASKGAALKALLRELGVAPENVLAIGDGENDIEMLQAVGIGVAVGNAVPALQQVADYVVATNEDDGVAEAIERFVLKKDQAEAAEADIEAAAESTSDADAPENVTPSTSTTDSAQKGE